MCWEKLENCSTYISTAEAKHLHCFLRWVSSRCELERQTASVTLLNFSDEDLPEWPKESRVKLGLIQSPASRFPCMDISTLADLCEQMHNRSDP